MNARAWHPRVWLLALALVAPAVRAQVDEYALKAAFLANFVQFTQWPVPPDEPFQLCVLARAPLNAHLAALHGKPVLGGRHINLRLVNTSEPLESCHAVYVDDSKSALAAEVLRRLAAAPVLTVSDSDGVAERGVMIEIHRRGSKLGFEVNLQAARRARLVFSARMLKLASYVSGAAAAPDAPAGL